MNIKLLFIRLESIELLAERNATDFEKQSVGIIWKLGI